MVNEHFTFQEIELMNEIFDKEISKIAPEEYDKAMKEFINENE